MDLRNSMFFLAFCCGLLALGSSKVKEGNGYIFTSPRTLKIGQNNQLQMLRFGNLEAGVMKVSLFYKEGYNGNETLASKTEYQLEKGKKQTIVELHVQPFPKDNVYQGRIQLEGNIGDAKINGTDNIRYAKPKKDIIVIQTDKGLYKAGQTVRIRVLCLDSNLKPSHRKDDVGEIYIEDPKGTRLFQQKGIYLGRGLADTQFLLADEPVFGTWRVTLKTRNDTETSTFDVKEYQLPKYEVKIKFPPFTLATTNIVPITVCANFTYGKPVQATLNLNVSIDQYVYYYSPSTQKNPVDQKTFKIDGCYTYNANITAIQKDPQNPNYYSRIKVVANVVQDGTGVQINATEYLDRTTEPLKLSYGSDDYERNYFKPGLPYNGKVIVKNPDDTPAGGETVELSYRMTKQRVIAGYLGTRTVQYKKNFTADSKGEIKFTIPALNMDTISVELEAVSYKYAGNNVLSNPSTSQSLAPFYSPSGSYIQLANVEETIPCGTKKQFKLLFTAKPKTDIKFYYEVLKNGKVLQSDTKKVTFTEADDISNRFDNDNRLINDREETLVPTKQQIGPKKGSSSSSSSSSEEDDSNCPAARESRYLPMVGETKISIDVDYTLSDSFELFVFYVKDDKETVADSKKFNVEKCFKNQVNFKFADAVKQPGQNTSIQITASPNSLCGVRAIDKSVTLINNKKPLTKDKIFQLLSDMNTNDYYSRDPCSSDLPHQPGLSKNIILPPGPDSSSSTDDSYAVFQESGLIVISDLYVLTRQCARDFEPSRPRGPSGPIAFAKAGRGRVESDEESDEDEYGTYEDSEPEESGEEDKVSTVSAVAVRNKFPETWLFELESVGPSGSFSAQKTLPDTITEWTGDAVCVSSNDGLGISGQASIRGFQLFFISYTLPNKAVRGEIFTVVVSVTSYANGPLAITVSLDDPVGFEVVSGSVNKNICIQPGSSQNLPVKLKATTVGNINITVRAETAKNSKVCGSSVSNQYARDAIEQSLEVVPEGFPIQESRSNLFCPLDKPTSSMDSYDLDLPKDYVKGSARAFIDISGNILGNTIKNLDGLVELPTGCGEQNLVKFVPNYLVLDYLSAIGELNDKTKSKAISNLNTGYQRELTYQRDDDSFSAFGNNDKEGSMFLTGMVIRSFQEAQRYITIDDNVIKRAQKWIVSRQDKKGCFPNIGQIVDSGLQGGLESDNSPTTITAYILASLLISKYDNQTIIDKAEKCLNNNPPQTPYETVLVAYAEVLAGKNDQAQKRLDDLKPQAQTDENGAETYFNPNGTDSIDLETVAYAINCNLGLKNDLNSYLPLVKDLATKLNPNGGFYSTQDTVIGLQALTGFSQLVYNKPINLTVAVSGAFNETVQVTKDNKFLVQRNKVDQVPGKLNIQSSGSGCGLVQITTRYNTLKAPGENKYSIKVVGQCHGVNCTDRKISGSVRYLPEGKSAGFSIVTVKMVTGIYPDRDSVKGLTGKAGSNVLRADIDGNDVVLYYNNIGNKNENFEFVVNREITVDNPQPGSATVVNYYNPVVKTTTTYKFADTKRATTAAPQPVLTTAGGKRKPKKAQQKPAK